LGKVVEWAFVWFFHICQFPRQSLERFIMWCSCIFTESPWGWNSTSIGGRVESEGVIIWQSQIHLPLVLIGVNGSSEGGTHEKHGLFVESGWHIY
jgi:hypothetical protein